MQANAGTGTASGRRTGNTGKGTGNTGTGTAASWLGAGLKNASEWSKTRKSTDWLRGLGGFTLPDREETCVLVSFDLEGAVGCETASDWEITKTDQRVWSLILAAS